ncbi:hypothetical protein GCM10008018_45770 [Paenibacillus marchantiophytorum]|uniref:Zinc ribbon domain-containing protein n=1 Tax=Paenibacillus marchantiophytorum TaxID=1619310 RepID=A0ABQ1EZ47_9BACL|nr:zinc ribbon domain-containing protein [Paenibacillus marchantiophytorum]GFZ94170.1 hypothetical protein GCM10008018_45770 [Paenibacillus marchantiophytorum]
MIKCPNCSTNNKSQKFCGNCGSPLLVEGVEFNDESAATFAESDQSEIKIGFMYGSLIFFQKLITWIFFFCVGAKLLFAGSINLLPSFTYFLQLRKSYFFVTSLLILLFL